MSDFCDVAACASPEDTAILASGRHCGRWAVPVLAPDLTAPAVCGQLWGAPGVPAARR